MHWNRWHLYFVFHNENENSYNIKNSWQSYTGARNIRGKIRTKDTGQQWWPEQYAWDQRTTKDQIKNATETEKVRNSWVINWQRLSFALIWILLFCADDVVAAAAAAQMTKNPIRGWKRSSNKVHCEIIWHTKMLGTYWRYVSSTRVLRFINW